MLTVGSVVLLNGGNRKVIIASRYALFDKNGVHGYYEYVYDKVSNDLSETYNWDSKIGYPPQSLISAFEQEMKERLKSC